MDLTVVGFIIAVFSIVLQVADAFPEHRETRKVIVLLTVGTFIGIAASALLGAQYSITGDVDRRFALLYILAGGAAFFGLLAVTVGDENRRSVALAIAGASAVVFALAGFAVAISSAEGSEQYSTDEVLVLANVAERNGQYETAIDRLKELARRVEGQPAREAIRVRIARLQRAQIGPAQPAVAR